jgi:hypothetical protein
MTPMQPNPVKEALELAVGYITDAMAEAQAEYELNAPYPLRAKQFKARLESINADLEKVQHALTQPAIPEGWQLAPLEPTIEMIDNARLAWQTHVESARKKGIKVPKFDKHAIRYKAMLKAASDQRMKE